MRVALTPFALPVVRARTPALHTTVHVRLALVGAIPAGHDRRRFAMAQTQCEVCGNDYDKAFQINMQGAMHTFDSFECAIQKLAPRCSHCGCRIIGHGMEAGGQDVLLRQLREAGRRDAVARPGVARAQKVSTNPLTFARSGAGRMANGVARAARPWWACARRPPREGPAATSRMNRGRRVPEWGAHARRALLRRRRPAPDPGPEATPRAWPADARACRARRARRSPSRGRRSPRPARCRGACARTAARRSSRRRRSLAARR